MSLGYALIHPTRIEGSLRGNDLKQQVDDGFDLFLSTLGVGDLSQGVRGILTDLESGIHGLFERLLALTQGDGALAFLRTELTAFPRTFEEIVAKLERLADFLSNLSPPALKVQLNQLIDGIFAALPELTTANIARQVSALLGRLFGELQGSASANVDARAHRAYRAAAGAQNRLGPLLDAMASAANAVDLHQELKRVLGEAIDRLDTSTLDAIRARVAEVRESLSGIGGSVTRLSSTFTMQVDVDGPQGMCAGPPALGAEDLPVPHDDLCFAEYWVDVLTNSLAGFNLTWEMVRNKNVTGRPLDITLSVVNLLWQITRTTVRGTAVASEGINQADRAAGWFFNDLGDFFVQFMLRFFGSLHEAGEGTSNYFLSFAMRGLKYYASVAQIRFPYLFARSIWYFDRWRVAADAAVAAGEPVPRVAMSRFIWAVFTPMWALSAIVGAFMPWSNFGATEIHGGVLGATCAVLGGGVIFGYTIVSILANRVFSELHFEMDAPVWGTWAVAAAVAALVLVFVISNTDIPQENMLMIGIVGGIIAAFLVVGLVLGFVFFADDDNDDLLALAVHLITVSTSLVVAGLIPFFLWWYFVDDGRDKEGLFEDKDAASSPYFLPYAAGQAFLCGQGTHGFWSHTYRTFTNHVEGTGPDNHLAYDFNEAENKAAHAARDGIVVQIEETIPNGSSEEANRIVVMHTNWIQGHDPGSEDERVLTYSQYLHLSQNHVWVGARHRVLQGTHLADIDDTGHSAQHHLHFDTFSGQVRSPSDNYLRPTVDYTTPTTLPTVFRDPSTHVYRRHPLLVMWPWPGNRNIAGKPISLAYYESANVPKQHSDPFPISPTFLLTDVTSNHFHDLLIDRRQLALRGDTIPDTMTLVTEVANGHSHELELTREQLFDLMKRRGSMLRTASAEGHTHALQRHPVQVPVARSVTVDLAHPPGGQIVAKSSGPYDVRGRELILRVDGDSTEYFPFGAHRPSSAGLVALDRGPFEGDTWDVAGGRAGLSPVPATPQHLTVRQSARALSEWARAFTSPQAVGVKPVVVLESRKPGHASRIRVLGGSAASAFDSRLGTDVRGSGSVANLQAVTVTELAAVFDRHLNGTSAWPLTTNPASSIVSSGVDVTIGGSALTFQSSAEADVVSKGSTRLIRVLSELYAPTASDRAPLPAPAPATVFRSVGPMPLCTGRVTIRAGTSTFELPIVAQPARTTVPLSEAAFTGTGLDGTALTIKVRGNAQSVTFKPDDRGDVAKMARRINLEVEGVRAGVNGSDLIIETVAAGAGVELELEKARPSSGTYTSSARGAAPTLLTATGTAGSTILQDSTYVSQTELRALFDNARGHRVRGGAPTLVEVTVAGDRLELSAPDRPAGTPHTIRLPASAGPLAGADGLALTAVAGTTNRLQSRASPGPISLPYQGWIDVEVDGRTVHVPLDAEPARLELELVGKAAGGDLQLEIDGVSRSVSFDPVDDRPLSAIAHRLAETLSDVTVRLAYRLVFEGAQYRRQSLDLLRAPALAAGGFLHGPVHAAGEAVYPVDLMAFGWPTAARGATALPSSRPFRTTRGSTARMGTVTITPDGLRLSLAPTAGDSLTVTLESGAKDPLGFGVAGNGVQSKAFSAAARATLDPRFALYHVQTQANERPPPRHMAETYAQVAALPAAGRTGRDPTFAALASDGALEVRLYRASTGLVDPTRVDLAGLTSLADVAERLQGEIAGLKAWTTRSATGVFGSPLRLHVESIAAGTDWVLELIGKRTLLALGFVVAEGEESMTFVGRGNVADADTVSLAELVTIFDTALGRATVDPDWPLDTDVTDTDGDGIPDTLTLNTLSPPLALSARPASVLADLQVMESPTRTALTITAVPSVSPARPPRSKVRLDTGEITLRSSDGLVSVIQLEGRAASVTSPHELVHAAADVTSQLAALRELNGRGTRRIRIVVDNTTTRDVHSFPPGMTTLEDAVHWLSRQAPEALFRIHPPAPGPGRRLIVASRRKGSDSMITVDLTGVRTIPASGLLGFSAGPLSSTSGSPDAVAGRGTLPFLDDVPISELRRLFEDGARRRPVRQAAYQARFVSPDLIVETVTPGATLRQITASTDAPGQVGLTAGLLPSRELRHAYGTPDPVDEGSLEFASSGRTLRALAWGRPARLRLQLPSSLGVLTGKTLRLEVNGTRYDVAFHFAWLGVPVRAVDVASQIDRATGYRVSASVDGDALVLDTFRLGKTASIAQGPAPTNDAVTGNRTTGCVVIGSPEAGDGIADDLSAVTGAEYAAMVQDAVDERQNPATSGTVADEVSDRKTGYLARADVPDLEAIVESLIDTIAADPAWTEDKLAFARRISETVLRPYQESGTSATDELRLKWQVWESTATAITPGNTVTVASSDANDTTQLVVVRGVPSGASAARNEVLALSGTTEVTGTVTWDSISAAFLVSATAGIITVTDAGTSASLLTVQRAGNPPAPSDRLAGPPLPPVDWCGPIPYRPAWRRDLQFDWASYPESPDAFWRRYLDVVAGLDHLVPDDVHRKFVEAIQTRANLDARPRQAVLESAASGSRSRIDVVSDAGIDWEQSLALGAAQRASIRLGPITPGTPLTGEIPMLFNERGPITAGEPPARVSVTLTGQLFSSEAAARINEVLSPTGLGTAVAYGERWIVVETNRPGLDGSIRIPPTAAESTPFITALLSGEAEKFVRGWPGAGFPEPPKPSANRALSREGFRSEDRAPTADVEWTFIVTLPGPGPAAHRRWTAITRIAASTTLTTLANQLDADLGTAANAPQPNARIGICRVGSDGRLYIEFLGHLEVFEVRQPDLLDRVELAKKPGETTDLKPEPGLGLRRTDRLRTFRMVRDPDGKREPADLNANDYGWMRVPTDEQGDPTRLFALPAGAYLLAARAEGAKAGGYDADGEMIVAPRHEAPSEHILQTRYWVTLDGERAVAMRRVNDNLVLEFPWDH